MKRAATGPRPVNHELWQKVARRMPTGISSRQLHDELSFTDQIYLKNRLASLRKAGYLLCTGRNQSAVWRTTTKAPPGHAVPPGSVDPGYVYEKPAAASSPKRFARHHLPDDDDDTPLHHRNPAPKGRPPGVPNSVWQLGDMAADKT